MKMEPTQTAENTADVNMETAEPEQAEEDEKWKMSHQRMEMEVEMAQMELEVVKMEVEVVKMEVKVVLLLISLHSLKKLH